jgi:hypothetical protein
VRLALARRTLGLLARVAERTPGDVVRATAYARMGRPAPA